jgi:hypothetical protein
MAIGPGVYDDLCTEARQSARAAGCILIILGGACGSGFSCQASPAATHELPAILRELADQIERDAPGIAPGPPCASPCPPCLSVVHCGALWCSPEPKDQRIPPGLQRARSLALAVFMASWRPPDPAGSERLALRSGRRLSVSTHPPSTLLPFPLSSGARAADMPLARFQLPTAGRGATSNAADGLSRAPRPVFPTPQMVRVAYPAASRNATTARRTLDRTPCTAPSERCCSPPQAPAVQQRSRVALAAAVP